MKRVLCLSVILVLMLILSGCNFSTPADIDFEEWGLGGPTEHGRSARIGDVVLYYCKAGLDTYLNSGTGDVPQKLEEISENFAIDKISSSDQYFYLSGKGISEYYNGDEEDEEDESSVGWDATRREVTHFTDEEGFLENQEDHIENWTKITGDSYKVAGKEWFRQKKDEDHSVPFYTDTVYSDVYHALMFLLYVDGRESTGQDTRKSDKYVK